MRIYIPKFKIRYPSWAWDAGGALVIIGFLVGITLWALSFSN